MAKDLAEELAPRLRALSEGGYERAYRHRGALLPSSTHQLVADLLDALDISYDRSVVVPVRDHLVADFVVNKTYVFVGRAIDEARLRELAKEGIKCVVIEREAMRTDGWDHGVRVLGLGESGDLQTIFLDDPSFGFDYAHILPRTQKCSVMHGHTSSVLVELVGRPIDGMVVDFGAAKDIVRETVRGLDHKLFINERYVTARTTRSVCLSFNTVHGEFAIRAPVETTVLLPGEATVENLAREVVGRVAPRMPDNVTAVGVYVYEGLNKGSHLLARVHREGRNARKKR